MSGSSSAGSSGRADGGGAVVRVVVWVAVIALLSIAAVVSFRTQRRITSDPAFCGTSCHHEPLSSKDTATLVHLPGFATSGHREQPCQECHVVPTGTALKLLWQSYTGAAKVEKHGKESSKSCENCHEKQPQVWRLIAETAGHRAHRGVKKVDCLSCHKEGTHSKQLAGETCTTSCHKDEKLHKATTNAGETCVSCHSFAVSAKNAEPPTTVTCEKCHSDPKAVQASSPGATVRSLIDVNEHALHGGVACQLCHNAHGKKPRVQEGQPVCANCHKFENFATKGEDRKGPEEHRKCVGCHKPHAPRETALQNCVTCHEKNAKGITKQGEVEKTTALKHKACTSCHVPHSWKAERSGCMQCHKDKAEMILTRSPEQHGQCTNCHDIHGAPPTGALCLKCHSNTKGSHVALAPEKHKDCTNCHNPHAPRPAETRTVCVKCHQEKVNEVMAQGPEGHAKTSCFGCHKPHENPLPPPNVCAKCHAERAKVVATAGPPKHRTCTSCHQKHAFKITDIASACQKCHGLMFKTESGEPKEVPHNAECKKCHTLHGSPGVPKTACFKCHTKVEEQFNPPNEKHSVCRSCHQPHTPASTAPQKCRECHEAKATVADKWPAQSAHFQKCNGCHQQHDVRVKKACADCHKDEAASATGSKHQCIGCHAPHKAPPGTGKAWWSRCNECHSKKVESVKERGPIHSECKNCHQQHRFAVPTCTTCHKDMGSKGLHASPTHAAKCASCHDPHVKSLPGPAQCRACHTDRMTHEPDAKRCQACHLFK